MIFFGHVGLTVGAVHLIDCKVLKKKIDLRKIAILAVLPDLIDKPIALRYSEYFGYHSRLFAHSLIFTLLSLGFIWALCTLRNKTKVLPAAIPLIFWISQTGHLLLDRVWQKSIEWFLWPFLGKPAPLEPYFLKRWWEALMQPYNFLGEIIGLSVILFLILQYRLFKPNRACAFIKNGKLI